MSSLDPTADVALLTCVGVSLAASLIYVAVYVRRPWRSTPQGKALMTRAVGDLIVLGMALTYALFGDYPFRAEVRLVGFGVFMTGTLYLLWSLLWSPGARDYPPWKWGRRS